MEGQAIEGPQDSLKSRVTETVTCATTARDCWSVITQGGQGRKHHEAGCASYGSGEKNKTDTQTDREMTDRWMKKEEGGERKREGGGETGMWVYNFEVFSSQIISFAKQTLNKFR